MRTDTCTKAYDNLYRLTQISNIPSADAAMTFNYAYNPANQRTAVTNADATFWAYGYDQLGQVTSGKKYFKDGVPVAGQQFEYAFDDIGNRKYAGEGGNEWGTGLRYQSYAVNNLNQYTQRTVPGAIDVVGTANSNATVTVNTAPTYRHSDYFRAEPKMDNRTSPVYTNLSTIGVLANGTNKDIVTTNSGNALLPKNPEVLVYDSDGNLTTNGLWILTWDAENRLVGLDPISTVPDAAKKSLRFRYDFYGRRISKTVSNWTGSAWAYNYSTKFVYDGWNLLAEVNATNNTLLRSFTWGIDASGTLTGAGGVGALIIVRDLSGASATNSFLAYDSQSNVRSTVNAKDGTEIAVYDYDAFGGFLRAIGNQVSGCRFSTKYHDEETAFLYYGARYAFGGRWLSRDPVGEIGGPDIYGFCRNSAINLIDLLGLTDVVPCIMCHGVSAFGYNGNPNSFSSYVPGNGPNAKSGYRILGQAPVVAGSALETVGGVSLMALSPEPGSKALGAILTADGLDKLQSFVRQTDPFFEQALQFCLPPNQAHYVALGKDVALTVISFRLTLIGCVEPSATAPSKHIAGVTREQAVRLRQLLEQIPGVSRARAFGSRTTGNLKQSSDLDIALFGKVNEFDPIVQQKLQAAVQYARSIGLGNENKVLDINIWDNEHWMLLDFLNSPNYDPNRGIIPIPKKIE